MAISSETLCRACGSDRRAGRLGDDEVFARLTAKSDHFCRLPATPASGAISEGICMAAIGHDTLDALLYEVQSAAR